MTPFMTRVITDEISYFGREHIIKLLTSFSNMGVSKEIVGIRRSGKTCLLKIMEKKLREDPLSKVYPIFFDFKNLDTSVGNGTQLVYQYIISLLIEQLYKDKILIENITMRGIELKISLPFEDIFENLSSVSKPKIVAIFKELIETTVQKTDKCVLFLIDEYESLIKDKFTKIEGVYPIRDLCSDTLNGKKQLSCWFAGAVNWSEFCIETGSPPLNFIDSPAIYLGSLEKNDFHAMWEHELSFCQDEFKKKNIAEKEELAFSLSGGMPHYGKQIGQHYLNQEDDPDSSFFKSQFDAMQHSLNVSQKQCISKILKNEHIEYSDLLFGLAQTGLVKKTGQEYEIIPLFSNYLSLKDISKDNVFAFKTFEIAERALDYFIEINQIYIARRKKLIFENVPEIHELWKSIRNPCVSDNEFNKFISALYKLFTELSQDKIFGQHPISRLPKGFSRNDNTPAGKFIESIDALRHPEAHVESKLKSKMKRPDVWEDILGSRLGPQSTDDYQKLQIELLNRFDKIMKKLLTEVKSEVSNNPNTSINKNQKNVKAPISIKNISNNLIQNVKTTDIESVLPNIYKILEENKIPQNGWSELKEIGKPLKVIGFDCKDFGCEKLRIFFESFSQYFDIKVIDNENKTPYIYVRKKQENT